MKLYQLCLFSQDLYVGFDRHEDWDGEWWLTDTLELETSGDWDWTSHTECSEGSSTTSFLLRHLTTVSYSPGILIRYLITFWLLYSLSVAPNNCKYTRPIWRRRETTLLGEKDRRRFNNMDIWNVETPTSLFSHYLLNRRVNRYEGGYS